LPLRKIFSVRKPALEVGMALVLVQEEVPCKLVLGVGMVLEDIRQGKLCKVLEDILVPLCKVLEDMALEDMALEDIRQGKLCKVLEDMVLVPLCKVLEDMALEDMVLLLVPHIFLLADCRIRSVGFGMKRLTKKCNMPRPTLKYSS
jgi:hypothetical protein